MEKKKLLLDIDEVFCFAGFLPLINEFLGSSYIIDDFTDYYIDEAAIPKERFQEFTSFKRGKNLYENATILPGAVETLRKLSEYVDIYPCSDCLDPFDIEESGHIYGDKFNFLRKHLPFIPPKNYIFTGTKNLFKADFQIDDRVTNLKNDVEVRILFPSYHNKDVTEEELEATGIVRAGIDWRTGWQEIERILLPLVKDHQDEPK